MTRTLQLRTRLAIAGLLLIATTVTTGVWSVTAFRTVSREVERTVTDNQRMTDATANLAGTLEREDDAMLLALSDPARGRAELAVKRREVVVALATVVHRLADPGEHEIATQLQHDVAAYEHAVDTLVARADAEGARMRYHEEVNPLLRHAVATTTRIRDEHFRSSQAVAEWAGRQSTRSMEIVGAVSLAAFLLLLAIVFHLARVVMRPIGEMTRSVQAIRRGDFSQRVGTHRADELGRLGEGLNQMADELDHFRRTNIGEVIAANETLEATLEALPDAVVVIDRERKVSAANPRATETLGFVLRRELASLPLPASTRAAVDAVLRSGEAPEATVDLSHAIELAVRERPRRLLPRIVPIAGHRGAVLVLSDVSDLARLDEMRLELLAVASHELRTPLTTMRMSLTMLEEHASGHDARERELVANAAVGVAQLDALIAEFLDLTRIEAGQLRLQRELVSPRDLVLNTTQALRAACEEKRIELVVEVPSELAPASVDRARLAMVVTNLLTNAIKYTPVGGRIAVRASEREGRCTIEVDDSGPGIPAEYRERVFDRFFRVEHEQRRDRPGVSPAGVGIGLYIARQVVNAHGGSIRCEAAAGGGARFVVVIPIENAACNSLTTA